MIKDSQKPVFIEEYTCNYCSIYSIIEQLKCNDMESPILKLKEFTVKLLKSNENDSLENLSINHLNEVFKIDEYCEANNMQIYLENIKYKPIKTNLQKSSIIKEFPSKILF